MLVLLIFGWYYYCVDTSATKGTGIAIDLNHNPHIVYYSVNNQLIHAWWNGTVWQKETVAPVASYHNDGPSVTIDNMNRIHIAYFNNNQRLSYARFAGSWVIETVDTTYRTGDYCDIEIDANGNPHIVYYRYLGLFSGYLRYARKVGTQWQITELTNEYGGFHSNIEIDTQGRIHITDCTSWGGGDLRYIFYDGQNWQIEKPVLTNAGGYNSLVLDNQNRPQISFYWADGTNFDLKFTNKNTGTWQVYLVDHGLQLFKRGWDNHLAIDNNQVLHIAYHCHNEELVKYARGSGNSWTTQIVDTIGGYSSWIDIALDRNDVFICYHHEYTTELWLASTKNLLKIEESVKEEINPRSATIVKKFITIPAGATVVDISGSILKKNSSNHDIKMEITEPGIYFIHPMNKGQQGVNKVVVVP
ncbi:MAG: BNR repeat-containing protein [candidate division WOR-3 bacterium]|nr:BNR repeat-containing protein [candidate division WOR-3 bacterium]